MKIWGLRIFIQEGNINGCLAQFMQGILCFCLPLNILTWSHRLHIDFVCVFLSGSFMFFIAYNLNFGFSFPDTLKLLEKQDWRYLSQLCIQIQQIYIIELQFVLEKRSSIGEYHGLNHCIVNYLFFWIFVILKQNFHSLQKSLWHQRQCEVYRSKSDTTMHWVSCHTGTIDISIPSKSKESVECFYLCDE